MKYISVKWVDGIVVVEPKGPGRCLSGGDETEELDEVLRTLDEEKTRRVVINLGQIGLMTSLALSTLVRARARFAVRGAGIKISNLCDRVNNLFVITKVCFVFDVYPTEREAIASFKAEAHEPVAQAAAGAQGA